MVPYPDTVVTGTCESVGYVRRVKVISYEDLEFIFRRDFEMERREERKRSSLLDEQCR